MSGSAEPHSAAGETVRLGARRSPLARAQVDQVAGLLAAHGVRSEFVGITTQGDTDQRALTEIGGTGVFAGAVREALLAGRIDIAVHSFKDLPTAPVPGLEVAAVPAREDPRDVLVGRRLADLDHATVGTGSPRRAMQLHSWAARQGRTVYVVEIRGNVDTRLDLVRSEQCDAVVLAAAGLRRLGRLESPAALAESSNSDIVVSGLPGSILDELIMLPAPAQGALALEVARAASASLKTLLAALDDRRTRLEVLAERGLLATLEAGCSEAVGARALVKSVRGTSADLTLAAVIGRTLLSNLSEPTKSGSPVIGSAPPRLETFREEPFRIERSASTDDGWTFGEAVAREVLAQLPGTPRARRDQRRAT